jgi:CheY-like chemotaxis protein
MNTKNPANQQIGNRTPVEITMLARRAGLPFATTMSPGLASFYGLESGSSSIERADLHDLVWAIALAINGSMPAERLPTENGERWLLSFVSFVQGHGDAESVEVLASLQGVKGAERLYISRNGETVPISFSVLVVEDDAEIARLICQLLSRNGFEAKAVETAADALARAAANPPDLIIMDVDLPDLHGFDLCARLRSGATTKTVPIVIMSAWHGAEDAALQAGAAYYLEKPGDLVGLPGVLRKIIGGGADVNAAPQKA